THGEPTPGPSACAAGAPIATTPPTSAKSSAPTVSLRLIVPPHLREPPGRVVDDPHTRPAGVQRWGAPPASSNNFVTVFQLRVVAPTFNFRSQNMLLSFVFP